MAFDMTEGQVHVDSSSLQRTLDGDRDGFGWLLVLFSGFWMIGWAVGEVFAIREPFTGETPGFARLFLVGWLGCWTVGGAFIGYAWLWTVFGVERIALRRHSELQSL